MPTKRNKEWYYSKYGHTETVDKLIGIFNNFIFKHKPILTDFLDPGQRVILQSIVGNDALIQEFGGYDDAEKKRVYLNEEWENLRPEDYEVVPFEIEYPQKFITLNHSSILGTLANSGIDVDTFGDIITDGKGRWQFFGKKELTDFFTEQIDRIGKNKVKVREIDLKQVLLPEDDAQIKDEVVASLRLDSVLAGISRQSRVKIKEAIENNEAKLNWQEVQNSNIMVKVNDVISLRHFGRLKITNIATTRKGKYKVVLKLWQAKNKK